MPNNNGPLQTSGNISIPDIANVFYAYKSYTDGGTAPLSDYYGNKVKYYVPLTPKIAEVPDELPVSDYYGRSYGLPVPVFINSAVNNYNLFDNANTVAFSLYGIYLTDPIVPFLITLTNNSTVGSTSTTAPALVLGGSSDGAHTINANSSITFINNGTVIGATAVGGAKSDTYTGSTSWTVPQGVTSISVTVVGGGGGGGGGTEKGNGYGGGGGGGGAVSYGTLAVSPGNVVSISVGSGGNGAGQSNLSPGGGDNGGGSSISCPGGSVSAGGGKAGGRWGGGAGGSGGSAGSGGGTGGGDHDSGSGGKGGNSYGNGGGAGQQNGSNGTNGGGGGGGGFQDRCCNWGGAGGKGGNGLVIINYTINIPGGDAVSITKPITLQNAGLLSGGISSIGASGQAGRYIVGYSNIKNPPIGGRVVGTYA